MCGPVNKCYSLLHDWTHHTAGTRLGPGLDHLTQRGRQTGAPLFQRTRTQRHLSGTGLGPRPMHWVAAAHTPFCPDQLTHTRQTSHPLDGGPSCKCMCAASYPRATRDNNFYHNLLVSMCVCVCLYAIMMIEARKACIVVVSWLSFFATFFTRPDG